MKRLFLNNISLIILMMSTLIVGCAHNHDTEKEHQEEEHKHDDLIVFDPHQAEKIGLQTEIVRKGDFLPAIKVSGKILSANGNEQTIVANTNGIISFNNHLYEGIAVRNAQNLFAISAKGLENGDPIAKAKLDLANAESEMKRAEELVQKQIISKKEYEQIKLRYDLALESLNGINKKKNHGGVQVAANLTGFIKQILVKPGDYVAVGQPLAIITQNQKLQLRAEVSERDFAFIKQVRTANFKTGTTDNIFCLDSIGGRLVSNGKSMTDGNFFIPVTFEFNNVGDILPGSFAEIWLIGNKENETLSIPVSALTEEQGVFFVYIQKDKEHYEKREVKVGQSNGLFVEVTKGVQANEKVVSKGAIHVKLASQSGTIPEGHNHNH